MDKNCSDTLPHVTHILVWLDSPPRQSEHLLKKRRDRERRLRIAYLLFAGVFSGTLAAILIIGLFTSMPLSLWVAFTLCTGSFLAFLPRVLQVISARKFRIARALWRIGGAVLLTGIALWGLSMDSLWQKIVYPVIVICLSLFVFACLCNPSSAWLY